MMRGESQIEVQACRIVRRPAAKEKGKSKSKSYKDDELEKRFFVNFRAQPFPPPHDERQARASVEQILLHS